MLRHLCFTFCVRPFVRIRLPLVHPRDKTNVFCVLTLTRQHVLNCHTKVPPIVGWFELIFHHIHHVFHPRGFFVLFFFFLFLCFFSLCLSVSLFLCVSFVPVLCLFRDFLVSFRRLPVVFPPLPLFPLFAPVHVCTSLPFLFLRFSLCLSLRVLCTFSCCRSGLFAGMCCSRTACFTVFLCLFPQCPQQTNGKQYARCCCFSNSSSSSSFSSLCSCPRVFFSRSSSCFVVCSLWSLCCVVVYL